MPKGGKKVKTAGKKGGSSSSTGKSVKMSNNDEEEQKQSSSSLPLDLLSLCKADKAERVERVQSLWSGYGEIVRYKLTNGIAKHVIVKHVNPPTKNGSHPRGWDTDISQMRKLRSYEVEREWYSSWSRLCDDKRSRVAHCYGMAASGDEVEIALEDLDDAGFSRRCSTLSAEEALLCLRWLAHFHAEFMVDRAPKKREKEGWPKGLWEVGCYWHLATRPDELENMNDCDLKTYASEIDDILNSCRFQTIVHGDAKVANFCFSPSLDDVAAVDFQYVGGGCGMRDVTYFLGSCLTEEECEEKKDYFLDFYFSELEKGLREREKSVSSKGKKGKREPISIEEVKKEWTVMFDVAWADFHRFILGWCSSHWKNNSFSQRVSREVVSRIKSGDFSVSSSSSSPSSSSFL